MSYTGNSNCPSNEGLPVGMEEDESSLFSIRNPSTTHSAMSSQSAVSCSDLDDNSPELSIDNPSTVTDGRSELSIDNPSTVTDGRSLSPLNDERKVELWLENLEIYSQIEHNLSDEGEEKDMDLEDFTHDSRRPQTDTDLNLRDYQKELAAPALEGQNTIICCKAGSGKTRVALDIIIKHLAAGQGAGRQRNKVCFLARSVPLAIQQYKTIRRFLPKQYKFQIFTGESPNNMSMHLLLPDLDVVVLTPMILLNHINWKNVKNLSVFSLLVFDECHHAREGEPYNALMFTYMEQKLNGEEDLPQVVGLTASIHMENASNIEEAENSILQLCANLDVCTISVVVQNTQQLKGTVAKPAEKFVELEELDRDESFQQIKGVMELLEEDVQRYAHDICRQGLSEEIFKLAETIPSDRKHQGYMNWSVDVYNEASKIPRTPDETCLPVRSLMVCAEYLKKYHVALQLHDLVHVKEVVKYLDDCFAEQQDDIDTTMGERKFYQYFENIQECLKTFYDRDNPNLLHLMTVIEDYLLNKGPLSRGIIFVQTRAIADALESWLNRCPNEEIRHLKASVFTGANAKDSQGGMTQTEQSDLLEKFREGKRRILVATSVANEGIDVSECNLVIKYNHIGNETDLIQQRGRSRKKGGNSILMALPGSEKFKKEMLNKKRVKLMKQGIRKVRKYERDVIRWIVTERQRKDAEERKVKKQQEEEKKSKQKNKKFKLICKLCRKFCIDSEDIRVLCGNYRVLINKSVLERNKIYPITPRTIDDVEFIGGVKCTTVDEEGEKCNGPLGAYIKYQAIEYLTLKIKNFVVEEENQERLQSYKQWIKVPYPIDELRMVDIRNYLMAR